MTSLTGFTLVELLIVIAILAVLSVTVVIVLNPAELLRQARDSTRLADMAAINRSIALLLTDQSGTVWSASHNCTVGVTSPMTGACLTNTSTTVNGTGWVDVNFAAMTGGSPLAALPLDPIDNATNYYAFKKTAALTYEINANMESTKYSSGLTNVEENTKDGGNNATWYETGNDAGLDL